MRNEKEHTVQKLIVNSNKFPRTFDSCLSLIDVQLIEIRSKDYNHYTIQGVDKRMGKVSVVKHNHSYFTK